MQQFINIILIGLAIIVYTISYFYGLSIAPITDAFQSEYNATSTEIGFLSSSYWMIFVPMQIPGGILVQFITSEFLMLTSWTCFTITLFLFSLPFNREYIKYK